MTPYVDEIFRDLCGFRSKPSVADQMFCFYQTLEEMSVEWHSATDVYRRQGQV